MEKNEQKMQLPKITADDLFTTQEQRDSVNQEKVKEILISDIVDFKDHPFKVIVNDELNEMVESIKQRGVLSPTLVRPTTDGKYEMVAGHRRKRASELANLDTIPCIIRDLTDDEATIIMVDSNMQREKILPSERAFAYKMKLEALKHQGKRTDLTSATDVHKLNTRDEIGKENGISGETVRKYIRLTELIPELLELCDKEKDGIALSPAVEISYLTKDEQYMLLDAIQCFIATPSHSQAIKLRELSQTSKLTADDIDDILGTEKPNQIPKVRFNRDRLQKILPKNLITEQEMEDFVVKCVEDYVKKQKQREGGER